MSEKRILIVEDEIHIQRLIEMYLEKQGLKVHICGDGQTALKLINEGLDPHAIVLDIMMPGVDGLQVLRTLRNDEATKNIPVVLVTALAREDIVLKGISLGASDYIRKPFRPEELHERILKLIA